MKAAGTGLRARKAAGEPVKDGWAGSCALRTWIPLCQICVTLLHLLQRLPLTLPPPAPEILRSEKRRVAITGFTSLKRLKVNLRTDRRLLLPLSKCIPSSLLETNNLQEKTPHQFSLPVEEAEPFVCSKQRAPS